MKAKVAMKCAIQKEGFYNYAVRLRSKKNREHKDKREQKNTVESRLTARQSNQRPTNKNPLNSN